MSPGGFSKGCISSTLESINKDVKMKESGSRNASSQVNSVENHAAAANDASAPVTRFNLRRRRQVNHWPMLHAVRGMRVKQSSRLSISRAGVPLLSAFVANTYMARLRGLFAYPPLINNDALVLHPCSAVHTIGLKYAIDVVFVGRRGTLLKCVELKKNAWCFCSNAQSVIEMASGTIRRHKLCVGQRLDIDVAGADHD